MAKRLRTNGPLILILPSLSPTQIDLAIPSLTEIKGRCTARLMLCLAQKRSLRLLSKKNERTEQSESGSLGLRYPQFLEGCVKDVLIGRTALFRLD